MNDQVNRFCDIFKLALYRQRHQLILVVDESKNSLSGKLINVI